MVRPDGMESRTPVDGSLPAEVRSLFLKNLRRAAAALADSSRAALAYVTPASALWVVACDACPCSRSASHALADSHAAGRECRSLELWYKGRRAGKVAVCRDTATSPAVAGALFQLAVVTLRQIELEKENESLRAEVSAGAESLQAVRDFLPGAAAGAGNGSLLDAILARAVSLHAGFQAVLWVANGGRLEARACKNASPGPARDAGEGLLGRVLGAGESLVAAGRSELAALGPSEPELSRAAGAVLVPVPGKDKALGVLEVWDEEGQAAFDARTAQVLTTLAVLAAAALEGRPADRASAESDYVRRDIEIAARIQQTLLLGRPRVDLQLVRADAVTIPSLQIGGDFYDFFAYDKVLDVIVGDVMGKGVPAALLGAATKLHFLRAAHNLMASAPGRLPEPGEILAIVNAELYKQLEGIESFVTLCYARFDLRKQRVDIIDCGHTRTVHARGSEETHALLQGENMPLGFSRVDTYKAFSVPFGSGDVFFFYSDGITEARDPRGEEFGEGRLARLICELKRLEPTELVEKVGGVARSFSGAAHPRDDITCVAVKVQDLGATVASLRQSLEILSDRAALPQVGQFLRELFRQNLPAAVSEEEVAKLEPAVVGAVSDIIRHAYRDQPDGKIRLEANLFVNRFSIRIYHRGEPFDLESVASPPGAGADEAAPVPHFGREHVDAVRYSVSKHGEHCVLLQKVLKR
jgi:sigma-B regulation protein RsbU (phosphoserine phosphatase)